MSSNLTKKDLSENDLLNALTNEINLNKKRIDDQKYEAKFDFGKCLICNDDATGKHFGVSSCEGCKGFFRRSAEKHVYFKCRNNTQNCQIYPKERKKCKLCRWKACIRAGMSIHGVRVGRIPNSMKKIKLKTTDSICSITKKTSPIKKVSFNLSKLDCSIDKLKINITNTFINEKYMKNSNKIIVLSLLRDKTFQIYRDHTQEFDKQEKNALKLIENGYKPINYTHSKIFIDKIIEKDMIFFQNHASSMLKIVKELPGFQRVSDVDINQMINCNFFSVLILRTIKLYFNGDCYFMLDENIQLNKDILTIMAGKKLINELFDYTFSLKDFSLTDQEIALLIPFFLTTFSTGFQDTALIRELNEYYRKTLYYEFCLNNRNNFYLENLIKVR
uniref:Nuclear receptor n=1 Tax=Brachionus calyciflorus TaxID=104777 RepID=A0A221CB26_9BILA|nr:nuclear receptor [Brachionus calyciflorus]